MKIWKNTAMIKILIPMARLYRWIMQLRNRLYDQGVLKTYSVSTKVISVGNITVGGTGKTPVVEAIAAYFLMREKRVAIQSRGYGRSGRGSVVVSDGKRILATSEQSGDEPFMLANNLPGAIVMVGEDRYETVLQIHEKFKPDVIILDDAFQHRRIHRDLDIVTVDTSSPWGNGQCLPAGPLRESPAGLQRAHLIVLTRSDDSEKTAEARTAVSNTGTKAMMTSAAHEPVEWIHYKSRKAQPLNFLKHKQVISIAGIGNPDSFLTTLKGLGVHPMEFIRFPDHHRYKQHDMDYINSAGVKHSAMAIITTEKDGARLHSVDGLDLPVYCLKIRCAFHDPSVLEQLLDG